MAAPPSICLQDLDRDELLQLFAERLMFPVPISDLWDARWMVLSRRAGEARERQQQALSALVAAGEPLPARASIRRRLAWLKKREATRLAYERAVRTARRLDAAADRAWKALEASYGRSAA